MKENQNKQSERLSYQEVTNKSSGALVNVSPAVICENKTVSDGQNTPAKLLER
jgi:hypothetical protein